MTIQLPLSDFPPDLNRGKLVYHLNTESNLSHQQIADKTGLTLGMVKRDIYRYAKHTGLPTKSKLVPTPVLAKTITTPVFLLSAVFDLEVSSFTTEGYEGILICATILPLETGEPYTLRLRFQDHGDDRELVQQTIQELSKYQILIGHNIAAFDLNWLYSRNLFHKVRGEGVEIPRWIYYDTFQIAKNMAVKTRKGLGNLIDYFGLEGEKTSIYRSSWSGVRSPYRKDFYRTMREVVDHCEKDVLANRELFNVLWEESMRQRTNPLKWTKWA